MSRSANPPVPVGSGGSRIEWARVPSSVRSALESRFDAAVVSAESQPGGFSPAFAARVQLANGCRFFVKAAGTELNPDTPDIFRREARIAAMLPRDAPVSRLLWTYDDGDWIALIFEIVEGQQPAEPWRPEDLERVLAALPDLWERLTPAPIEVTPVATKWQVQWRQWNRLASEDQLPAELATIAPWSISRLEMLAELEVRGLSTTQGNTLLHGALRADNFLIANSKVVVVDWPSAMVGPCWVDLLCFLPSVAMHGFDPEALFTEHPASHGVDPDLVTSLLAAITGYFIGNSIKPPPPGLQRVRPFQLAQGRAALAWLKRRLGIHGGI